MNTIIEFANTVFQPLMNMGAAPLMTIILTFLALLFKVKPSEALEGGLKLGIALTGISAIIDILTSQFSETLQRFVESTGITLNITDVGWAPVATIMWGSPYTLFFLLVLVLLNIVLLVLNKTNTLDVDIFNVWHSATIALFAMYCGASLLVATIFIVVIGILRFINSDLLKPTFNDLLDAPDENPMTTVHITYMMNPFIMIFDKLIDKFLPGLDKYDFDSAKLNSKIGFWGSNFSIGIYLGIFVGLLARESFTTICTLAFTAAVCLELFSLIGSWFVAATQPLSTGISNFAHEKLKGRRLNIGLDWPFIAGRSEMWAAANVLAPILLLEAIFLPGNRILPLGAIISIAIVPALLVVTRGKIIRMIIIGAIEIPLFLWSGTLIAPFITEAARNIGAFPSNVGMDTMISISNDEGPIEKFLAYLIGEAHKEKLNLFYMLY